MKHSTAANDSASLAAPHTKEVTRLTNARKRAEARYDFWSVGYTDHALGRSDNPYVGPGADEAMAAAWDRGYTAGCVEAGPDAFPSDLDPTYTIVSDIQPDDDPEDIKAFNTIPMEAPVAIAKTLLNQADRCQWDRDDVELKRGGQCQRRHADGAYCKQHAKMAARQYDRDANGAQ